MTQPMDCPGTGRSHVWLYNGGFTARMAFDEYPAGHKVF
jgi:hypothetical protein